MRVQARVPGRGDGAFWRQARAVSAVERPWLAVPAASATTSAGAEAGIERAPVISRATDRRLPDAAWLRATKPPELMPSALPHGFARHAAPLSRNAVALP